MVYKRVEGVPALGKFLTPELMSCALQLKSDSESRDSGGKEVIKAALEFARAVAAEDMESCQLALPQATQVTCHFNCDSSPYVVVELG